MPEKKEKVISIGYMGGGIGGPLAGVVTSVRWPC